MRSSAALQLYSTKSCEALLLKINVTCGTLEHLLQLDLYSAPLHVLMWWGTIKTKHPCLQLMWQIIIYAQAKYSGCYHSSAHARGAYGSRSVCLSVTALAAVLHTSFVSLKWGVTRFFMAFQTYVLCRFRRKRFVLQFWCHLLLSKKILMDRTNRTGLFSRYKLCSFSDSSCKLTDSPP